MKIDETTDKKVVVGMSGGVDSSITMLLLKRQGWQPIGVSLKLETWKGDKCKNENACCTEESLKIAKEICQKLGVKHYIYDVRKDFKKEVMDYFLKELKNKRTPNPCVICNRHLKFEKLFEWAHKHNIKYVSTGHYAKIKYNNKTKEQELILAKDQTKDQTYGLCLFPKKWIQHIVLPLGELTKKEVYETAKKEGLNFFLKKKQSQDLCFVSKKDLPKYIKNEIGIKKGSIIEEETNKIIGTHKGLHFYTIGQKRKMNLPGTYFIKKFNTENNSIIVTKDKNKVTRKELLLKNYNFISGKKPTTSMNVKAKIRYGQEPKEAIIHPAKNNILKVKFKEPQFAVTPGQICVFYKEEKCLGGGIIE